ncbi:hypothetical protein POVCU2_0089860 [Plasmodium ovale curtisi]|uniref:Uncharacterized protein n=1 Tax=Plasmodium ovale curtisi TaxID=864141 RepID=A0A1A8WP68_PLAOA|nr:hypothetical protein POVCU2_0089860 [Plasmodium ovale curtisi]SBT00178.1 hypothetical protein POVCU1_058130 [Plasmodium ovale curtisi]
MIQYISSISYSKQKSNYLSCDNSGYLIHNIPEEIKIYEHISMKNTTVKKKKIIDTKKINVELYMDDFEECMKD